MSYLIEKKRRVLLLDLSHDERMQPFPHLRLFCQLAACNNVHPHPWSWSIVAVDADSHPNRSWGSDPLLPERLYLFAHDAGGGGIKPDNRDVTGVGYLQLWETAVREARRIRTADFAHSLQLSCWLPDSCKGKPDDEWLALKADPNRWHTRYVSLAPATHARFMSLPWKPCPWYRSSLEAHTVGLEQFVTGLQLLREREALPLSSFSFHGQPQDPFFTAAHEQP